MFNVKRWFIKVPCLLLTLGLISCSKPIPINLVEKLEKPSTTNTKIGFVTLFDSDKEQANFLSRETKTENCNDPKDCKEVENTFSIKGENAKEIREVSAVSVLGLSGIKINDTEYNSCKYISIDNQNHPDLSELICKINEDKDVKQTTSNSNKVAKPIEIEKELFDELSKSGGINNLGFAVLNDYMTGEGKLVIANKNYVNLDVSFPLPQSSITSLNAWTVVTYRQNPCKQCKVSTGTGKEECVYIRDQDC
ncbi:MAG: hypothetical protein KAZ14_01700 [Nitrosomonas sp.]|jgi:hypothetical protein|nr:hypothetical protein [Nitrosomonas sp.]MDO8334912.1 hypothetical protein [Nitrosomonas sp.]